MVAFLRTACLLITLHALLLGLLLPAAASHSIVMSDPYVAGGVLVPGDGSDGPLAVVPGVPCATEFDATACFPVSDLHDLAYVCWTEDAVFGIQFDQPWFASQGATPGVHTSGAILAYGRGIISGTVWNNLNALVIGVPAVYLDGQARYDGSAGNVVCEFA